MPVSEACQFLAPKLGSPSISAGEVSSCIGTPAVSRWQLVASAAGNFGTVLGRGVLGLGIYRFDLAIGAQNQRVSRVAIFDREFAYSLGWTGDGSNFFTSSGSIIAYGLEWTGTGSNAEIVLSTSSAGYAVYKFWTWDKTTTPGVAQTDVMYDPAKQITYSIYRLN